MTTRFSCLAPPSWQVELKPIGCIDVDPCFVKPGYWDPNGTPNDANDDFWVDGDYHLRSKQGRWEPIQSVWVQDAVSSPCIDAGNPYTGPQAEISPNGSRINCGAYGGTVEASLSESKALNP